MESTGYDLPTWAPLPARADPGFDELARRVAAELQVPRALVVLVSKSGQVYPGAFGLPEPWDTLRSMPLTHSMSLRVAATGMPLVLRDAREDPESCARPAVREMSVVGYAAMPLTDVHGRPIGVLSVSDDRPRAWTSAELEALRRLAAEVAGRLRQQGLELAEREALAASDRAHDAARKAAASASAALLEAEAAADRARVVLRLSQELLSAAELLDVLRAADRLVRSPLGAGVLLLGLAEAGCTQLRVWTLTAGTAPGRSAETTLDLVAAHPLPIAVRDRRAVPVATREAGRAELPGLIGGPAGSAETSMTVPLVLGQHTATAALLVGWGHRRELDAPLQQVVTDLGRHLGHALDRVLLHDQRRMLTGAAAPVPLAV